MRNTKRNLVSVGAHLCTTAMLAAAITFLGAPHTAQACGGFFCFNRCRKHDIVR